MKPLVIITAILTASVALHAQDTTAPQSWTASDGRVIQAKFIKLDGESVVIEKDGQQFAVPFAKLNADSVALAKKLAAPPSAPSVSAPTTNQASDKPAQKPVSSSARAEFGSSVAMDGGYVVIGGRRCEVAKVFDSTTGALRFVLPDASAQGGKASFGYSASVAISGTKVVVGIPSEAIAYVYDLSQTNPPVPVVTLKDPAPKLRNGFAHSVAISGSKVVVGGPRDATGAMDAGTAYVFDLGSAKPGEPLVTLNNPNPAAGDGFGKSVAISGSRVVVGVPRDGFIEGKGYVKEAGCAYVYDLANGKAPVPMVTLQHPDKPDDTPRNSGNWFGNSVGIDGTRVVVGAHRSPGETGGDKGSAVVFDLASSSPTVPIATLKSRAGYGFGYSVAISGSRVVVVDGKGVRGGYVYDLTRSDPTVPVTTLSKPKTMLGMNVTYENLVAISGTRVVIGDPQSDKEAGTASLYDLGMGNADPVTTLTNPDPAGK